MLNEDVIYKKTPQQLTALLYEAASDHLATAKAAIENKEFASANRSLSTCTAIFRKLSTGIDYQGGVIAEQLAALYSYLIDCSVEANLYKNREQVVLMISIVNDIREAWQEAILKTPVPAEPLGRQRQQSYEAHVRTEPYK
ncbi:flagellar export chaperone FliS [Aureibacillus halotolerans]|uniref:Flagellar protein FliS n=1 Tax=Aureibacillus halotolerans TaxID=1508390 RepID=A0A4R6TUU1_9BACI|nr:flagellar export chaperone FliS [Aureibacillus halotolerans]TDQ36936.1 flagellar protein FliS [Aureibacillus halotolerans]